MDAMVYREESLKQFRGLKRLSEKALAQTGDEDFFRALDPESNSIALIVKHVAGNLRSRWTDFLTSDGEKPGRNRDSEFLLQAGDSRESIMGRWEEGWAILASAVEPLTEEDFSKTVLIRGEPHSVVRAITRQIGHYAYHVGQLVFLAKHFAGPRWQSLSIPRGMSEQAGKH
jgi:DNA helicase HerA-like ATPase